MGVRTRGSRSRAGARRDAADKAAGAKAVIRQWNERLRNQHVDRQQRPLKTVNTTDHGNHPKAPTCRRSHKPGAQSTD
jgi:hypothetical protein